MRGKCLAKSRIFGYNTDMIWNLSSLISDPIGSLKAYACIIPVILLSLTLHEWGHAYAAHLCGDDTAKNLGRMTVNPFAHLDLLGFLSMLLLGFGWAKPVPVNPRNYRIYKKGEAVVSLAGVFMNLLLAIAFSALTLFFLWLTVNKSYAWLSSEYLWMILYYGISMNITLMLFNLLPIFPLDGYHIFELLLARVLPTQFFLFMRRYGRFVLIGVLILINNIGFSPASALASWVWEGVQRIALKLFI